MFADLHAQRHQQPVQTVPPRIYDPTRFVKVCQTQDVHAFMMIATTVSYDADYVRSRMGLHPDINAEDAATLDRHIMINFGVNGIVPPGLWLEEGIRDAKAA
jgi:hypothetical protein